MSYQHGVTYLKDTLVHLILYFTFLAMSDHFISEMAQKAAAAKRLEKVQREAALEAVKMAKRERGVYKIHIFIACWHCF